MFTGIVQHIGPVRRVESTGFGSRLWLELGPLASAVRRGDSVAVNGVCLTAGELRGGLGGFDAVAETLRRSTLGRLSAGRRVNMERALRVGDGLDGHIVQGHVDGVATVARIDRGGGQWNLHFACTKAVTDEMVTKGSVAVDGVSLTLTEVADGGFAVTVIPTTLAETTLAALAAGDEVNVETDILGKYVRRLLGLAAAGAGGGERPETNAADAAAGGLTLNALRNAGFTD